MSPTFSISETESEKIKIVPRDICTLNLIANYFEKTTAAIDLHYISFLKDTTNVYVYLQGGNKEAIQNFAGDLINTYYPANTTPLARAEIILFSLVKFFANAQRVADGYIIDVDIKVYDYDANRNRELKLMTYDKPKSSGIAILDLASSLSAANEKEKLKQPIYFYEHMRLITNKQLVQDYIDDKISYQEFFKKSKLYLNGLRSDVKFNTN